MYRPLVEDSFATDVYPLERDVRAVGFAARGVIPFGSWALNLQCASRHLLDELAFLFRQTAGQITAARPRRKAPSLYLLRVGVAPAVERLILRTLPPGSVIPADGFLECRGQGITVLCSEVIRVLIVAGEAPRIYFVIHRTAPPDFRVHLSLMMNMVLLHFQRILLHAGAVQIGRRVHLFVGERGTGKSTVCLRLAADGGTLLSDDHVVIQRAPCGFTVSGCSGRARVTRKTERFLLARPLDAKPKKFAGLLKKEFDAGQLVPSRPFRDYRAACVYFLRLGGRFALQPMSRHRAVAELLRHARHALRFRNADHFRRCLDFLSGLVAQVDPFQLELSPRLADLDRLSAFLSTGDAAALQQDRR